MNFCIETKIRKNMRKTLLAITAMVFTLSCGSAEEKSDNNTINSEKEKTMNSVFEIAINQSKDGKHDEFLETRAKFVEVLGKEEATLNEGKWQPFFTVVPDINLDNVLIGMTEWYSMQAFGETAARLLPQDISKNYFASFNPLAYAMLETVDGKAFDMNSIKVAGNVVEFAIRTGKNADAFGEKRETFFNSLNNYDGYKFAREFKVYELDQTGTPNLIENKQAVIIVWESMDKFQAAAQAIFGTQQYQDFAAQIDVSAYFATMPVQ